MSSFSFPTEPTKVRKALPHNFLVEQAVLSCLLANGTAIELTIPSLVVEAFYFKNHQELYKALLLMYHQQLTIDLVTLLSFLQDNGLVEKVGGLQVLVELTSRVPNFPAFREYLQLLKEKWMRRSVIKLGYEIINSSYITNISVEKIVTNLETEVFQLSTQLRPPRLWTSAEVLKTIFLELKQKSVHPRFPGISTGFYQLDALIHGFQNSDLIILAARPSMGKTALSLNLALNAIKHSKVPVLFFSLEMSKEQILYRLLSMESRINQMRLKSGKLSPNDWRKLTAVMKVISKLPFFIDDTSNLSLEGIQAKLKTLRFQEKQIGLVVIDYLQLMQDSRLKTENRVQELSKITRGLKIMAKEFNLPIIALSQLSRTIETRLDKTPMLSDLRESGSIEQDADLILMLYHPSSVSRGLEPFHRVDLLVAKHRNGPIGSLPLKFDPKYMKFGNFGKDSSPA